MISFENVYQWMFYPDLVPSYSAPVTKNVNEMLKAIRNQQFDRVNKLSKSLINFADAMAEPLVRAEIFWECAYAFAATGDYSLAEKVLKKGILEYRSDRRAFAIAKCMSALINYHLRNYSLADHSFDISLQTFRYLINESDSRAKNIEWYHECVHAIERTLDEMSYLSDEILPPDQTSDPKPSHTNITRSSNRRKKLTEALINSFPILGTIPAGKLSPKEVDQNSMGNVGIHSVEIDHLHYRVYSLTTNTKINLGDTNRYFVLKVTGDSMNLAGIEPDDYVLIRVQDGANDGDIVAAMFKEVDEEITLKRFYHRKDSVTLMPESDNITHQSIEIYKHEESSFTISGIVLAVLKLYKS